MPFPKIPDAGLGDWNEIVRESIWGGDGGYEVFAECYSRGLRIIFRFSIYLTLRQSIQSRIVTCYHGNPAANPTETFVNMDVMREAVSQSVTKVWNECSIHLSIKMPDVVVEIYEDTEHLIQWRICHLGVYKNFATQLLPLDSVIGKDEAASQAYKTVEFSRLVYHGCLGGRGDTAMVSLEDPNTPFAFKGVDMVTYLFDPTDFTARKDICYHEIRTIRALPPHPQIISPAKIFVTVPDMKDGQQALVCGTLYPYMRHLTLEHQIQNSNETGERIPPPAKAKWCFQLASAITHTHHVAHTYHMDIKSTNILLNDDLDILLIDWEQSGAPYCTVAPEADGSWDVEKADTASGLGSESLVYKKYDGPARRNTPFISRPGWNVFPIWRAHFPRALEAAEVYSVGRTMWMLLQQVEQGDNDDPAVAMYWDDKAYDIPEEWKGIVGRCLEIDPQKRITLLELATFWEAARGNSM